MLAGADPAFDDPVVLFQNIVEILHRSVLAILLKGTLGFELYDGWRVGGVLVGVDDPRVRMVRASQGFGSETAGRRLHCAWPRARSRSSHRWSPQPGTSTPICLSPGRTSRRPAKNRLLA